ncbi:TetR/AcrR family transcriptional regulator [Pseudooceanicola onchidii]|uniref:TetR/AcrR family transcriptional regulator n=1 Tax=Pseudooceanicola onchidii TaxID=2562279 RepID=UPI0010AB48EB|nr:TetR/AcrR family transcriptional regulator [Pseudooceanicola onchidii]
MTRQGEETRARLIRAAVALYQSQGYHATGVAAILTHAGVPKGSMYHHFPDGKQELTVAAVDWLTQEMIGRFARAADGKVAADKQVMRLFTDTAAWVEGHDYTQGALLSLLAQEVEAGEVALRTRIAAAYRDVTTQLAEALEAGGATQPEDLATTVLAALDGGIARARAQRSTVGLHRAGEMLAAVARR